MLPPPPSPELDRAVLRMILYFDVFKHPLTLPELTRLVAPEQPVAVADAARALEAQGRITIQGRWVFLPGRAATIARRQERAAAAERAWPAARSAAAALQRFPFVRGLLVTGGMSKNSTSPDGDIDWLILVEPGRIWTLKSLLQLFRRGLPDRLRERFCTNYLLDTDHLTIDDRNLFTAIELATAVPIAGPEACTALIDANPWATRFVPGMAWSRERASHALPLQIGRGARAAERAWSGAWTGPLERAAMQGWRRFWATKYGWLDPSVRSQRFKQREEISTNHLHDFQDYVLREVEQRNRAQGVSEPLRLDDEAS